MTLLEKNSRGKAITCDGSLRVGNKEIKCMKPHGLVRDMEEAFTLSCNVWFMKNALSELDDDTLGISFKRFMGRAMKKELGREDIALSAIGQGEVLVSPMELAMLAASVGNKGMTPEPHFTKENLAMTKAMDKKTANKLTEMMIMVVKKGTAKGLSDYLKAGRFVAAKTGTAERDTPDGKVNTAVLIGLAGHSKDKPEIAFSIVIEKAQGYGGTVCVPMMKEILDYYFSKGKRVTRMIDYAYPFMNNLFNHKGMMYFSIGAVVLSGLFYGNFIRGTFSSLGMQPDIQKSGGRLIAYPLIFMGNIAVLAAIGRLIRGL